ncbi:hypothetical protein WJX84_012306, partial [Apatococcus fuscideae]
MNVQTSQVLATVGTIAAVLVCKRLMGQNKPSRTGVDLGNLAGIVSFSARIMAAWRAIESEEENCLVCDPLARDMAGEVAMADTVPTANTQPWEYSPGTAAPERRRKLKIGAMAVRTAYLDREVMGHLSRQPAGAAQQVVNLGAGLDTRPWRLDLPEGVRWIDVDKQDVTLAKQAVLEGIRASRSPAGNRTATHTLKASTWTSVAADLADEDWTSALFKAGFDPQLPTLWILEGLIMYLSHAAVDRLLADLARLSGQGSLMALMLFRQTILDASKAQDTHKRTIPGSTSENEMYQKSPAFKQLLQSVGSSLSGAPDDPEQASLGQRIAAALPHIVAASEYLVQVAEGTGLEGAECATLLQDCKGHWRARAQFGFEVSDDLMSQGNLTLWTTAMPLAAQPWDRPLPGWTISERTFNAQPCNVSATSAAATATEAPPVAPAEAMRSMSGQEIREAFLKFYEERGHTRVASASLVPDDPTVLLTIAGMLPFKPIFLGQAPRQHARATSSQKCIRTNDIENVGVTARHHTFFEMLGNFSFGDYFKEQAIQMAWELSTKVFGLPQERIWVSVFEEDQEAFDLWEQKVGVSKDRIRRMGAADNFWAAGPTGPCGPCSELYFDFRPELGTRGADLEDDSRFIEFYNLVFMESNRGPDGALTPLARQNIDTGLGLERMAQILQSVPNNYETDLILPIMDAAARLAGTTYADADAAGKTALKVIGDHARAAVYLVSDGVLPSNVGRGYIVRRLIRRIVMKGRLLGIKDSFLQRVAEAAIDLAGPCDSNVPRSRSRIMAELGREEERFRTTLDSGEKVLE